jgi:hypothetical protein
VYGVLESGSTRAVEGSPSPLRVADRIQRAGDSLVRALTLHQYAFLLLASLGYFAITFYRAERRLFWFDEIFTRYIARLPDLASIWSACIHGVDFNPPMLYLLTFLGCKDGRCLFHVAPSLETNLIRNQ